MKLQLAAQLKRAGFCQQLSVGDTFFDTTQSQAAVTRVCRGAGSDCRCPTPAHLADHVSRIIRIPTLAQLIDECMCFQRLSYESESDVWRAEALTFVGEGDTADEAVAFLWLQLNKKAT